MIIRLLREKKLCCFLTVFYFLLLQQLVHAQVSTKFYHDSVFNKYAERSISSFTIARPYYIIEWYKTIPKSVKVIRRLNERMAIVELKNKSLIDSIKKEGRIAGAINDWKFSTQAENIIKGNKEQQFILSSGNLDSLQQLLLNMKDNLTIVSIDKLSSSIVLKTTSKNIIEKLLPLKEVIFIDIREEPHAEIGIIGYDRSFHGINAVDYSIPGANGKNIVAGIKEQKMDETDMDLYKRVLFSSIASGNVTNHATVISSIIGGAGNRFYDGRGIANGCMFFPSTFDNLFADDAAVLNTNKVTVQNHSYGTIIQQFYGAEAVSYDEFIWQNKNFIHVFSAGNKGTSFATDGKYANIPGYANLTGNFKMAKNIITVGAIDNNGNIPAESSAGPLYDGRVAPQLVALGPNGTSDAAAVVSGTIAVMQQVFADSNNQQLPPASLTKAVLYNTADDIYNTAIDYKTGYGLLNSYAAVKALQQKEYDGSLIAQGQSWSKTITVPVNAAQLKVTLSWTDTTASLNNNKALVDDLDLEVQDMSTGTIFKPWVLNATPNIDSLSKISVRKRDSLNTAEQVSIQLPAPGTYQITVTGTSISGGFSPFNIAYHTDTLNTFAFTSPQHASDVNREENPNATIRWRTFVADSNQTGNLFISYDNGTNWQLIKQSHKIYANQYQWPIKDTNSTAMLKMETSFGNFFSKEFIISKVIRPDLDFLCTDSFRLSWNKHVYAKTYKIFGLTDSPYLKLLFTVTDTFTVLKRSDYPWLVYAVEPLLSNNLPAARSIAIDITSQGVKCFYKTIYYSLQSQNLLNLTLELSAPDYTDSIYFEQVTAGGQLLQKYGGVKVSNSNSIYNQLVNDAPAGTSFWRARIKLKSGAIVYTEIISVLTSGKKYILFYPNPVSRNESLSWILLQDLPADSKLQLFDITGRLLKSYSEIPNSIDMRAFAPGMLIYKLLTNENGLLEVGKLIIK